MTKFLLSLSPDLSLRDRWNQSCLDIAEKSSDTRIQLILKQQHDHNSDKNQSEKHSYISFRSNLQHADNYLEEDEHDQFQFSKSENHDKLYAQQLILAVASQNLDEVKLLISKGCNANLSDYDKRTALHVAVSKNNLPIVNYLISLPGINVNPVDTFEQTPYDEAIRVADQEIIDALKKSGGIVINQSLGYLLCDAGYRGDLKELAHLAERRVDLNTCDYDKR
jgi:ankyrin repeat protein